MRGKKKKEERRSEKFTALLIGSIIIILSWLDIDWRIVGIYAGSGWMNRFLYPFFHVHPLHGILNAWCIICIVFAYRIKLHRIFISYLIAITYPVDTITQLLGLKVIPTVGLSGAVFFLFGSISFEVGRRLYYQAWILSYLAVGFLFPNTNAWLHIYCYLCGITWSLLNYPIRR